MKKDATAYLLARLPMGMSFFGHGFIRIIHFGTFTGGLAKQFSGSLIPGPLVAAFASVLPFIELLTGILLLLGLFSRFAICLGTAIILALIFGSSMIQQWSGIFTQLFYAAYLAALYYFVDYNQFSLDTRLAK